MSGEDGWSDKERLTLTIVTQPFLKSWRRYSQLMVRKVLNCICITNYRRCIGGKKWNSQS